MFSLWKFHVSSALENEYDNVNTKYVKTFSKIFYCELHFECGVIAICLQIWNEL